MEQNELLSLSQNIPYFQIMSTDNRGEIIPTIAYFLHGRSFQWPATSSPPIFMKPPSTPQSVTGPDSQSLDNRLRCFSSIIPEITLTSLLEWKWDLSRTRSHLVASVNVFSENRHYHQISVCFIPSRFLWGQGNVDDKTCSLCAGKKRLALHNQTSAVSRGKELGGPAGV